MNAAPAASFLVYTKNTARASTEHDEFSKNARVFKEIVPFLKTYAITSKKKQHEISQNALFFSNFCIYIQERTQLFNIYAEI